MTPEDEQETHNRQVTEAVCGLVGHNYETIEMPEDWQNFTGAVPCKHCPHSTVIEIVRTKAEA